MRFELPRDSLLILIANYYTTQNGLIDEGRFFFILKKNLSMVLSYKIKNRQQKQNHKFIIFILIISWLIHRFILRVYQPKKSY